MEKIQVTQKQADWLERYELTQEQIDHYINTQLHRKRPDSPIVDWDAGKLARSLYVGYEVIPEFFEGDWVVTKSGYVGQIEFICVEEDWANIGYSKDTKQRGVCLAKTFNLDEIERYATPEEIQQAKKRWFWEKLGREVDEYKPGDLVVTDNFEYGFIATSCGATEVNNRPVKLLVRDELLRIHINHLRLVTPVEQRLDK